MRRCCCAQRSSLTSSLALFSLCGAQVKLWNTVNGQCIRTLASGYGLCSMFVSGGRHAVIGTKAVRLPLAFGYSLSFCARFVGRASWSCGM
jgi:hypothetical protein